MQTIQIADVINAYHDLLTDAVAQHTDVKMRRLLKQKTLYFGDRPLSVVLRPHFYFEADWLFMKRSLETLLGAYARAHQACMSEPRYREQLLLDEYEEKLYQLDQGGPAPWSSSRLDTFYSLEDRNLKVVEYNAETPAGIGYNDTLADVFDELEPMKKMRERYNMRPLRSLSTLKDSLLAAYKQWGGTELPQIAILDWREVPTLNEHEITRQYLARHGIKALLVDPRAVEYRNGKLVYGDFRIDMIYKRVLYSELVGRMGIDNPVLNAVRDHAVFITNSPSAKLMAKKASLSFLSDEQNAHLFTPKQQQAIEDHIPWSRIVADRKTKFHGTEIELLSFIKDNKDQLVLKPNDEYGGTGVVLGWECSEDVWETTIRHALTQPYIVQERVALVEREFPSWINGKLDISKRYVDADPYIFNGTFVDGCLTRLSPQALLNVTAGGGSVVPTYIIT